MHCVLECAILWLWRYFLYLGGAVVEPKVIIKYIVTKIDISKINKIYKPIINVADPTKATP